MCFVCFCARYGGVNFRAIGIANILFGMLSIFFQSAVVYYLLSKSDYHYVMPGIWTGILMIVSGSLVLSTACRSNTIAIRVLAVFAVIGALTTLTLYTWFFADLLIVEEEVDDHKGKATMSTYGGLIVSGGIVAVILNLILAIQADKLIPSETDYSNVNTNEANDANNHAPIDEEMLEMITTP